MAAGYQRCCRSLSGVVLFPGGVAAFCWLSRPGGPEWSGRCVDYFRCCCAFGRRLASVAVQSGDLIELRRSPAVQPSVGHEQTVVGRL
ncbi:MAG: hypothetical protein ERJ67_08745 [Aphanocapsa feldmannii 277cV]|uniref:Uncharacterized protein n=1 Tax=Aphanocapsa feldmannii 277cV TaxID=2507553 RepID=A0A524RMA4_9CHRO|nr:MAG: hypothetical protein ERJ67_08745 [Aphanocapsa feldmannii 277cV]